VFWPVIAVRIGWQNDAAFLFFRNMDKSTSGWNIDHFLSP